MDRSSRTTRASLAPAARPSRHARALHLTVATALVLMLLLALCAPAFAVRPAIQQAAPWTFMVYLDGDNNLDPWGAYTLDLMAQGLAAGNYGNVAIPVLYDHYGDAGAEQGIVTAQGYVKLADVPEPDMSSGDTLAAFMAWAVDGWPAERYVLDVWDHGSGWHYLCSDSTTMAEPSDDPLHGRMLVDELARGIRMGERAAGPVDMVLFEACNMGMVEVSYELRGLCEVMVGTELTQDYEGVPWERTMATLDATPDVTTMDLGKAMCDDLVWSYQVQNKDASMIAALSAIDMSGQEELVAALDGLATTLKSNMRVWRGAVGGAAGDARNQMGFGGVSGYFWFADVYAFADELGKRVADPQVDFWCERVKAAVANGLYTAVGKNLVGKCYGLSIAFPPNLAAYNVACWPIFDYDGCGLDFTADTQWDEMLLAYYAAGTKKR
jgi:hypothetical protein